MHRDVSPQNVIVGADGGARVLDFGVAKAAGRAHTTREGQVKGKLPYMAPEQLAGGALDRRVDIFAGAIVLWEMLTGRRLFDAETEAEIVGKVLEQPIEPPGRVAPGVPAALEAVVMKGPARDPTRRFASALDMALALEAAERPALGAEVGAWVEGAMGETLRRRALRVQHIEREAASRGGGRPGPPAVGAEHSRGPSDSDRTPGGPVARQHDHAEQWSAGTGEDQPRPPVVDDRPCPGGGERPPDWRLCLGRAFFGTFIAGTIGCCILLRSWPATFVRPYAGLAATLGIIGPCGGDGEPHSPATARPNSAATRAPPPRRAVSAPEHSRPGVDPRCYALDANGIWHVKRECL